MRKLVGALAFLVACSSDSDTPSPAPEPATLPDGVRVEVGAAGELSLLKDGRTLLTLARGAPFVAKRYEEKALGLVGIWKFQRENEESFPADRLDGITRTVDEVVVRYRGEQAQVTVQVRPLRPGATLVRATLAGVDGARSLTLPVACDPESSFYGFGEQYNAAEQRGEAFDLFVTEQGIGRDPTKPASGINGGPHTTYFPMPYFLDARGHGALLRTPFRTRVDLCKTDPAQAPIEAMSAEPLEVVVFHGPTPREVIRELGDEVGRPKAPPPWAYELWMVTQGGRDKVLAQVEAFAQASLPVRALWVQDWAGQRKNADGGYGVQYRWAPDETLYPDLAGMNASLKQQGYRMLAYANPFIIPGLDHYDEMAQAGLLLTKGGAPYQGISPGGPSAHPDFTVPGTRAYVKTAFRRMSDQLGFDGWMADFGEWAPLDATNAAGVAAEAYHNTFPVEWHRCWSESFAEARPDGDYAVIARSGYTGVHRHAQIYWVGDQEADFGPHDGLPTVVPAMLSLGLSGIPFVTHDVAGFSGGPSTKELFWRWTELGAFTPIFRTHDGNKRDQNWSWNRDDETRAHFVRFARIHQALVPELREAAQQAVASGLPLVRHLMLAFPDDAASRAVHDQYMLGDRLLVAPVVTAGAEQRSVYLPPGSWTHVWTGQVYPGGTTVTVPAPLGSPPVFSLDGDRPDLRSIL